MKRNLLSKVKNKIKHELRGIHNSNLFPHFRQSLKTPADVAVIDFTSRRLERHYYFILKFLSLSGYSVFVIKNRAFLGSINAYKKEFGNISNIYFIAKNQVPDAKLYFYDHDFQLNKIAAVKKIFVRIDTFNVSSKGRGTAKMPLPMSVEQYDIMESLNLLKFRSNERKIRIFYSGNLNKSNYDSYEIKNIYKKLNRIQIIETLKNRLEKDQIDIKHAVSKFDTEGNVNKFVLFDWFWQPGANNLNARIDNKDWLSVLSKADFFLSCPGIVMPPTHAVVEAMAVGCVPIIEFPEFYPTGLKHLVNCLIFSGEEDLVEKVNLALTLSQEKIIEMRNEILKYYDNNLTPQAYIKNLESVKFDQINYFVYTDYSHLYN